MYVALKFQIIHTHLNRLEDDMMITFKALEGQPFAHNPEGNCGRKGCQIVKPEIGLE